MMNILEVYINLSQGKEIPKSELENLSISPEYLKKLAAGAEIKESLDEVKEGLKKAVESLKIPIKEIDKEINIEDYQKLLSIARIAYVQEQNGVPEEHAVKLLYAFGSYESAIAYLKRDPSLDPTRTLDFEAQLIHDACIFALPTEEFNIKLWQRLAGKYMPDYDFQKVLAQAPKIESYVKENRKTLVEKHRAEIIRKYEFQLGEEWEKTEAQKRAARPSLEAYIQSKMMGEKGKLKGKIQKDINKQFSYLVQEKLKELGKISIEKRLTAEERELLKTFEASEEGQKLRKDVEAKVTLELEHQFRDEYEKLASPNVEKQKYIEEHLKKDKAVIEENCRDALLKNASLETLLEYLPHISYKNASKNPIAAKLFFEYGIPEKEFDKYLTLKPSETSYIPEMFIDGDSIGYPGFYLKKLSSKDPKAAILGKMTSCCQWMGGQGAACAIHGITSPEGGFYVLCQKKKGQKDPSDDDLILAQTWAWRGKNNNIVFDSIESQINFRQENGQLLSDFFVLLAQRLVAEKGFPQVLLGKGATPADLTVFETLERENPKTKIRYRDSERQQYVLAKSAIFINHYLQEHPKSNLSKILREFKETSLSEVLDWIDLCTITGEKKYDDIIKFVPDKYLGEDKKKILEERYQNALKVREYLNLLDDSQDMEKAKELIDAGVDMYLGSKDYRTTGKMIFHIAAQKNDIDMVKYLVEEKGFDVNKRDDAGNSVLHYMKNNDNLTLWRYLIEKGADINIVNQEGFTPLQQSIESKKDKDNSKSLELVKLLIENGAEINKADKNDFTALHLAVYAHKPVTTNGLELIKYLIDHKADIQKTTWVGNTVLHTALWGGWDKSNLEVMKCLVEAGADVNKQNSSGSTVLHFAATRKDINLIKYLVEQGADVNITDNEGKTAFDLALKEYGDESHEIVKYLKEKSKEQKERFSLAGFQRAKETKGEKEVPETEKEPPTRATPD